MTQVSFLGIQRRGIPEAMSCQKCHVGFLTELALSPAEVFGMTSKFPQQSAQAFDLFFRALEHPIGNR